MRNPVVHMLKAVLFGHWARRGIFTLKPSNLACNIWTEYEEECKSRWKPAVSEQKQKMSPLRPNHSEYKTLLVLHRLPIPRELLLSIKVVAVLHRAPAYKLIDDLAFWPRVLKTNSYELIRERQSYAAECHRLVQCWNSRTRLSNIEMENLPLCKKEDLKKTSSYLMDQPVGILYDLGCAHNECLAACSWGFPGRVTMLFCLQHKYIGMISLDNWTIETCRLSWSR